MQIWSDDIETEIANSGENVKVKVKNAEEEDIQQGFVICSPEDPIHTCHTFDAQVIHYSFPLLTRNPTLRNLESFCSFALSLCAKKNYLA